MNKNFYALTGIIFLMLNLAFAARAQSALDGFDPNANGIVRAVAVQPDGKILIGGDFTSVSPNGGAPVTRNRLARLNHDGTLDASFDPNVNSGVYSIALQTDGKILLGGIFSVVAGITRNRIARVEVNGALDMGFDPSANNAVLSLAVQADGQVLAGGDFTTIGSLTRSRIARLAAASGAADPLFQADASSSVWSILVRPDGGIIFGGAFTTIGGQARLYIARLNPDSTLDAGFNPAANDEVRTIAAQVDGKILAGGKFTSIGGQPRGRIARLDPVNGLADSFNPGATSDVRTIAVQADGKILAGGFFTGVNSIGGQSRSYIARLDVATGLADSFNPSASSPVHALAVQAHGKVLVGGQFTTFAPNGGAAVTRNRIARVESDGTLDASFNPLPYDATSSPASSAIAVQADGKVLLGGGFNKVAPNGGAPVTRNRVARFNADGTLDTGFDPNVFDGTTADKVFAIALQADGKIILGGTFTTIAPNGGGTVTRKHIARLNANGTLDTPFDPNISGTINAAAVNAVAVQTDGKILIGGSFTSLAPNGGALITRNRIARLNSDGTVDLSFNPNANNTVSAITLQPDGKILVGGTFTTLEPNGGIIVTRNRIARLNSDGTLDDSFNPNAGDGVTSIALQTDGRILLGGVFTTLAPNGGGTVTRNRIARLGADGALDTTFDPNVSNVVSSIAVQTDGKILLGGTFTTMQPNGGPIFPRNRIARVNVDGTLDNPFNPNANNAVHAIALQPDGKILAAGDFSDIGGQGRTFARLTNDIAVQNLSVTPTSITWTHAGAGPVISRVTFEQSVDGVNYTLLGNGVRVGTTSDFTLGGQNLPTGQSIYIRARGFYPTGNQNGSASVTDSVRNVYLATSGPTPTLTATNTPTPTPTNAPTSTLTNTATNTPTPTNTPTSSPTACSTPGSLDMSFDGDGKVTTAFFGTVDTGRSVARQSDGKIIAAGSSLNGSNYDFALARYNTDGSLDTTFDGDGKVTTAVLGADDFANSVAIQSDGKIVAAGFSFNGTNNDFAVVRYNANGSLDTTFGGGIVTTAVLSGSDIARSVAIQPDGKIIAAGASNNGTDDDIALARYNTDGSLDTTFDGDGKVTTAVLGSTDNANSVSLQSDGKIVAAGYSYNGTNNDLALVRYNGNGSLDTTFDGDGKVTTAVLGADDFANSVAIQSDGKIVAAGSSFNGTNFDFALARYNANGSLDTTFDGDGNVTTAVLSGTDIARSVAIQPDGKIIAAGASNNGTDDDIALARYNADGSLDTTFDGDGKVTTAVLSNEQAWAVAIQPDGKIVAAGNSSNGTNTAFALVRYNGASCSSPTPSISGVVTYGNAIGNPLPPRFVRNVSIASTVGSPAVGPVITGTPGTYTLTGFGASSPYTIKPTKPGGSNGAITSNDAARVAQGVSGAVLFVSQNQRFAADASGNGGVTSNDAALIARFAAGLTGAGNSGQWKFFVTGAPSPLPTPPQVYDDSRTYASVNSALTGEDFVGILVGEVTGNWNPATHPRPAGKVNSEQETVNSETSDETEVSLMVSVQPAAVADKEFVIPVSIDGAIGREVISYEFDLRYDPSVIQPLENCVDVAGTVSRGLMVVTNAYEPGLLRVVVYGPMPIDENGVLLNLRFAAVGGTGSVSPLTFERILFNEGEFVTTTNGQIDILASADGQ